MVFKKDDYHHNADDPENQKVALIEDPENPSKAERRALEKIAWGQVVLKKWLKIKPIMADNIILGREGVSWS